MKFFKFELKKIIRRKKVILLFLIVLLFVIGVLIRNILMQDKIIERAYINLTPHHQEANNLLIQLKAKMKEDPKNQALQASFENLVKMTNAISELKSAIDNHEWQSIPKIENTFLKTVTTHLELGGEYKALQGDEFSKRLIKNAILIEHQLPYEDENYSLSMPIFMKSAASLFMSVIGVLILVFIMADQMSEELENQTIRTLYTQPLRRWQILLSKYVSMITITIFMLVVFFTLSMAAPLLFGGKAGSFAYPQLVQYSNGFTYIPTGEYLIKLILLFIGVASFAFCLVILFSILLKNRLSTILVSFPSLLCGFILTNQIDALQTYLNPFYYFNLTELIERPETLGFTNIWILFSYSFVVLFICYVAQGKGLLFFSESPTKRPFRKGQTFSSSKGFLAIILFEWRKAWRQGSTKQIIIVLLLIFSLGYIFLTYLTNQKHQNFIAEMKDNIESQKGYIQWHKQLLQKQKDIVDELEKKGTHLNETEKLRLEGTKNSIERTKSTFENDQLDLEKMKEVLNAYLKKAWPRFYEYWIYQNQLWNGEISVDLNYQSYVSSFTTKASIEEKKLLAERNLKPVLPPEYLYTFYDQDHFPNLIDRMEQLKNTFKMGNTGLFYLYIFFNSFIFLLPLIVFVSLFGSGFTAEKGKKRTLNFLETQPLSRYKIFIGKSAISLLLALGIAIGLVLLLAILGTVGNRFGDWTFPVLHYDTSDVIRSANYTGITAQEGGFHFINMGKYLLETVLIFLCVVLFIISISLFISSFTNNIIGSFTITLTLTIGGYFASISPLASSIAHMSPFTYLNVGKIANGELASLLNNSAIQTWTGLGVLMISSIIFLGAGLIWFQRSVRKHTNFKNISSTMPSVEKN
ncbi:ABC transporter permease subunit [Heyndrickxia sp. NPDC080065]|uniref:ABC transporter permease subunit n=1 Tax=Heyndrickxia sp. NPDC080065 TaxID=3390568 RepID=UPI003CFC4DEC